MQKITPREKPPGARVLRHGEKNRKNRRFSLISLSTVFEPAGIIVGALEADVEDAAPEELGAADQAVLLAKLQALSPLEQFALVDDLEAERTKT